MPDNVSKSLQQMDARTIAIQQAMQVIHEKISATSLWYPIDISTMKSETAKEAMKMFVIRLIGKIAALPLIVLTAIAGFLFNLATDLSGYVIGPALLLILGFDIYFLITTQWIHVAILTMLGAGCFAVLFGQAVVIVALEGARDGLIRFMRS